VIALDPSGYRRQPWKNGGGVSEEIVARRERDSAGWQDLVWSFSRTSFAGPLHFSDLAGFQRMLVLVDGIGLLLRAWDDGDDIEVPRWVPISFDGGRMLEGVPAGRVDVVNLMGRADRVHLSMTIIGESNDYAFEGDVVLLHAAFGRVGLGHDLLLPHHWAEDGRWDDYMSNGVPRGGTLLFDEGLAKFFLLGGQALVATITCL